MKLLSGVPKEIGQITLRPQEYCYHVYMPIKVGKGVAVVPGSLRWVCPLLDKIYSRDWSCFNYAYLSVKHMFVSGYGNRPGWHLDGFLTDDINYIWTDNAPTQFSVQEYDLDEDHELSLVQMEEQFRGDSLRHGKVNTLYRLDPSMVHRTPVCDPGIRTFVKVSFSDSIYNLKGNTSNPNLKVDWEMKDRSVHRNHPTK